MNSISIHFSPIDCEEKIFFQTCLRCGRILEDDGFQKWRWTGFNFGVDLVLISDIRTLSIKRHHRTENERLLSLQSKRNIMLRLVTRWMLHTHTQRFVKQTISFPPNSVTIYSLNEQRQVMHSQTTGIRTIQLDRNEESRLIYLDSELKYPVLISVNLLVTTPNKLPQPPPSPTPETISPDSLMASNEAEISTIGTTKSIANNDNNNLPDDNLELNWDAPAQAGVFILF